MFRSINVVSNAEETDCHVSLRDTRNDAGEGEVFVAETMWRSQLLKPTGLQFTSVRGLCLPRLSRLVISTAYMEPKGLRYVDKGIRASFR